MPKLKVQNCAILFFSAALQAFGMYHIHTVADITEGGVLGAILLIEYWFHISPAISSFVINTVCYLLGLKVLGIRFITYSFFAAVGYSAGYAVCELFPPLWPQIADMPLVAAIVGAPFIGIGAGLCVRTGGAIAGDDALAMSLQHITRIPIQWLYLISDLSVLILSLSYIPLNRIQWSLLTAVLSGQIIGWIQKIPSKKGNDP